MVNGQSNGQWFKVYGLWSMANGLYSDRHPEKIKELVTDLAEAFRNGRTTQGPIQSNEGWPFLDKKMMQHFPKLAEVK